MFMVREDPNLYFWDLRSCKVVKHFELYKTQHTRQNNIIVINVLMGCTKDAVITIIQFAKNTVPRRIKSICYVQSTTDLISTVSENKETGFSVDRRQNPFPDVEQPAQSELESLSSKPAEEPEYKVNGYPNLQIEHLLHSELCSRRSDQGKANVYFLSMSVNPIIPAHPVGKSTQGMLLLIGDNQGGSYCMVVDTKTKETYTYITKTESKHEEISTIMFTLAGSVKALLSGEIQMVSLLDSDHVRDRSLNKDLQDS